MTVPGLPWTGRTAMIIDDGIATGSTARAACKVARAQRASRVVLAAPVGPPHTVAELSPDADEVICLEEPAFFAAIGQFYGDFSQTADDEVIDLLGRAAATTPPAASTAAPNPGTTGTAADPLVRAEDIDVQAGPVRLAGHLVVPERAIGVVAFAHGSGSGRHSPRNRYVASVLSGARLATLLVDLLTPTAPSQPSPNPPSSAAENSHAERSLRAAPRRSHPNSTWVQHRALFSTGR